MFSCIKLTAKALTLLAVSIITGMAPITVDAKKTTITFAHWYNFNKPATDYMNKAVKLFEQAHPDIAVKQVVTSYGQGYIDKILSMSVAGMNPDIVMVSGISMTSLAGVLTELDALVNAGRLDESISYKSMWRGCTWKGKIIGVPFGGGVQRANFYNIDLFLKTGLNSNKPPLTWDSFLEACKKLTKDTNGDGKPDIYGTDGTIGFFQMMHVAAGGEYTTSGGLAVDWDSPAGIKAFEWGYELWRSKVIGGNFLSQKAAMNTMGPWDMGNMQKNAKFKWGITRYPTPAEDSIRLYSSVDALGIGKVPQGRKKAAWDFVRFLISPEMQAMLTIDTGFPAMNGKAMSAPVFKRALEQFPQLSAGNDMMKYSYAPLPTPKDGDIDAISGKYLAKVMAGTIEPKKAASDAQREAATFLARYAKKK